MTVKMMATQPELEDSSTVLMGRGSIICNLWATRPAYTGQQELVLLEGNFTMDVSIV